jgi:hypothetical protein
MKPLKPYIPIAEFLQRYGISSDSAKPKTIEAAAEFVKNLSQQNIIEYERNRINSAKEQRRAIREFGILC